MIILETGWSWEYVDENMTLPRLKIFGLYWDKFPPLRMMLAGAFGHKSRVSEPEDFGEFLGQLQRLNS